VKSSSVLNIIVTVVNIIVTLVKIFLNLNFCSFLDWLFAVNSSPAFLLFFHCLQNSGFSRNLKDNRQTCKIVSLVIIIVTLVKIVVTVVHIIVTVVNIIVTLVEIVFRHVKIVSLN
jgi:hypothetical protein